MSYKETDLDKKKLQNDPNISDKKGSITERLISLAKGRTVREVAARWGISTATVNLYLKKGGMPAIDKALAIANAEGVSIQWLTSGEESNEQCDPITNESEDNGIYQKLIDAIETMPPEAQSKLYKRIISKGFNSLDLTEAQDRWAALAADLSVEAEREIFAFAKKAKYMWLAGVPFSTPADIDSWDEKRA
ncbi:helix-turn-helix domain-containing protein [Vibrio parahaemolyticus]|uniref:helix-turn-helix domain-containing protein n=1 Tax=Vibrio parahaemolyticus TaxID=670 RepID=UPI00226B7000|nr:helix-turn-helix domain-containing protein [Vibrio parahaemolyticus]MCX8816694.1 helix-turn-helix domain containing protein [Vibrio parahaemolyticus]